MLLRIVGKKQEKYDIKCKHLKWPSAYKSPKGERNKARYIAQYTLEAALQG